MRYYFYFSAKNCSSCKLEADFNGLSVELVQALGGTGLLLLREDNRLRMSHTPGNYLAARTGCMVSSLGQQGR